VRQRPGIAVNKMVARGAVPLTNTKLTGKTEEAVKRRVQAKIEHYLPSSTDTVMPGQIRPEHSAQPAA
jgi:hypothetical protein